MFKFIKHSEKNIALHTCVLGTGEIYFNSKGVYTVSMNKNAIKQFTKISNYVSSEIKSYTMPLKQLQKVIELLHKSDLVYSVKFNDDGVLIINQDRWTIALNSTICDSNYESSFLEKQTVFTMDYKQAKAFKKSHCMSYDNSQVAFMGMYLDFINNKIVTTDGKALDVLNIKFSLKLENCILDKEFILKAISKMKKDSIIEIKYNNNEYFINDNNIEVIEGKFPNYNDVMPKLKINVIKIKDYKEFSKKIDLIKKQSDSESGRMILEVKGNLLYLSVGNIHSIASEFIEIENISNTDITLACNCKGLQMLVNENNTEIVINGASSPLLFIKENSKSLIMPMKNDGYTVENIIIESNIVEIKEVEKIELAPVEVVQKGVKINYELKTIEQVERDMKYNIESDGMGFITINKKDSCIFSNTNNYYKIPKKINKDLLKEFESVNIVKLIETDKEIYYCFENDVFNYINKLMSNKKIKKELELILNEIMKNEIEKMYIKHKETIMATQTQTQTQKEALLYIYKEFKQPIESMKELIHTVDQYNHEDRINFLEKDLEKTVFKGLKKDVYTLLSNFTEFEYLDSLYTPIEDITIESIAQASDNIIIASVPSLQAEEVADIVIEDLTSDTQAEEVADIVIAEEVEQVTDIEPITQSEVMESYDFNNKFILKLYTDRSRTKIYSGGVFKIETFETIGDNQYAICRGADGTNYKYNVANLGQPKTHGKNKGSISVNIAVPTIPTIEEIAKYQSQLQKVM